MGKSSFSKETTLLYGAYLLATFEDRAWSFCVSLCMELLGGMQLVSIEQLFEGVVQMLLSGHIGKIFDGLTRKQAIQVVMPINNFSLIIASAFFVGCLQFPNGSIWYTVCLILGILFCAINKLFLAAEKFIVGRDWVVVLGSINTLADLNATLTFLDQTTNVLAPMVVGILLSMTSLKVTCAIFGSASLVSFILKAIFLKTLYEAEPQLRKPKEHLLEKSTSENEKFGLFTVVKTYYRQSIFSAALGMSFLFMTVMGFDGLAIGYGMSIGVPEFIIGIFRSYGSFMGIMGAISYAFFEKRLGVRKSGLMGLVIQQIFVVLAVGSIWLPGSPMDLAGYFGNFTVKNWWSTLEDAFDGKLNLTASSSDVDWKHFTSNGNSLISIFIFLFAIANARYGLWLLDLCITQIMQVNILESERNTVFGVHNALCQSFSVLKDLLVIALPEPTTFGLCILISYAFVTVGHVCYVFYVIKYPRDSLDYVFKPVSNEKEDYENEVTKL